MANRDGNVAHSIHVPMTVYRSGQVSIPANIRRAMGIEKDDVVLWKYDNGRLELIKPENEPQTQKENNPNERI